MSAANIFKSVIKFVVLFLIMSFNNFGQTATLEPTLTMQTIDGIQVPFQNGIPLTSFEKQQRTILDLSGTWKKKRFEANHDITLAKRDESGYTALINEASFRHTLGYDDTNWDNKIIPFVENEMKEFPLVPEYYQDGIFYRYKFNVGDSLSANAARLIFYSVNYVADVWLNEEYVGYHEGGFTPFAFDVTDKLVYGGENLIVVRVDNVPWGSRKDIVPFYQCDWFNYAGIIQDVYLEFTNPVNVVRTNVVPKSINGEFESTVVINNQNDIPQNISVNIDVYEALINESNIESENWEELIGSQASLSGENSSELILFENEVRAWRTNLKIDNPKLWSITEPNLYILKVTLKENDIVKDVYHTQFGIRTITTDSNKVKLNDNVIFLTGAARHEDHPDYGRSIPRNIIYSDLDFIKKSKINFLRTGHYPNHPYTYLMADRIGLPIMEEVPVWWFDNELEWLIQNNERKIHEQMFKEMVFKDYNRPSIILWSTSNECKEETNRLIYNQRVVDDLKNNYPDGRLVSQSSAGDRPGVTDITQTPLDVAGWTLYFGIFHGSTYYAGTASFLSRAKIAFPQMPIIDTEFGFWSSEDGSNENTQVTVFNETFKAFKFFSPMKTNGELNENGNLMATTWWCVYDWYSHQHANGFQSMGLVSMDRQTTKPVYDALITGYTPFFDNGGTVITSVEKNTNETIPTKFEMKQNYPNPFNPTTSIEFSVPSNEFVSLKVFDIIGNEIAVLVNEKKSAGNYKINFDGKNLSSGIYFYKMTSGNFSQVRKMMLIK